MNRQSYLSLLCLTVAACASNEVAEQPVEPKAQTASHLSIASPSEPRPPVQSDAAGNSDVAAPDDAVAALWRDPRFRRQLAESYLAETEIEPRITISEREAMEEILELIAQERLGEAIEQLNEERAKGGSAVFDFTLANIHFQRDELEPAAQAYEAAVLAFPKFRRAYKNLGLIRVREGEHAAAAQAFTRVIELGGGDGLTYGLLGYAYSSLENHIASESAYRMANLLDPQTGDWKMGLARSFFKQQRYGDASALLNNMIEEAPDRAELWMLQANAFIGLGKPLRAAENFEIVERLGKSTAGSLNSLGDIYINEELYDLAVHYYLRALEVDDTTNIARAMRASRVLTSQGALDDTERLVAGIVELRGDRLEESERKDILKLRARLAVAGGASEEEVAILEEIVALDPLDGEALILLGQHAQRAGENEQAVFYYERAQSLEAFEANAKVRHGQLLVSEGKYTEALNLLRSAQTLEPRDHVQQYIEQVERIAKNR
jgi:tetratricopeptide (TPR) repeat protein